MPTLGDTRRAVQLHVPAVDPFLIDNWIAGAWADLFDTRPWVARKAEGELTIQASRTVAVTVTAGAATLTSAALFLAADAGRQIKFSSQPPIYTILTRDSASQLTLDRAFAGTSGAATATIYDAYATMPADFGGFLAVYDPARLRPIAFDVDLFDLNRRDPARLLTADAPRALVAAAPLHTGSLAGRTRYEYWPAVVSGTVVLPYLYMKRPAPPADDTELTGLLGTRSDILETGALAEAARWPGTREHPNPYFNLALYRTLREDYDLAKRQLSLRDDDLQQQSIQYSHPWDQWAPWLPMTDIDLRASDSAIDDLFY